MNFFKVHFRRRFRSSEWSTWVGSGEVAGGLALLVSAHPPKSFWSCSYRKQRKKSLYRYIFKISWSVTSKIMFKLVSDLFLQNFICIKLIYLIVSDKRNFYSMNFSFILNHWTQWNKIILFVHNHFYDKTAKCKTFFWCLDFDLNP